MGNGEFVFSTGPDDQALPSPRPDSPAPRAALRTMSPDPSGLPADASGVGRMARDLNAFFKIANVINSTRDVQALQRELLELICEVIPAAQAAIVLQPNANEEASPPCTWSRKGLPPHEMHIRKEWVH